jgi:hypothetical protein
LRKQDGLFQGPRPVVCNGKLAVGVAEFEAKLAAGTEVFGVGIFFRGLCRFGGIWFVGFAPKSYLFPVRNLIRESEGS